MESMFAIGIGYVAILLPAILLFTVLNARQKGLEKRLDALVQMARISGEVVGIDEISQPLAQVVSPRSGQRWGIILTVTAAGLAIAGMLMGVEGILGFAIAIAGLGIGLILAQVWSDRVVETPPKAAL
ncbi:MAG: hypothetical protein GWP37_00855 [Gammaproteobacteria bacterium]|jgi:hypothetical protein|nr:hypothetical protein [Gammaproteobacteria bacterium]